MKQKNVRYRKGSAGVLMHDTAITAGMNDTVQSVINRIKDHLATFENDLQYIFVLDQSHKLKGLIPISDLFLHKEGVLVSTIMIKKYHAVTPGTDQEVMATKALKSDMYSMPVVDRKGVFLGVVPTHTIFTVLSEEHSEDLLYAEGIQYAQSAEAIFDHSVWKSTRTRLPWLLTGLIGGVCAALVVERFESVLDTYIILAFFLPLVVYMSDAVAGQTQAILIRAIALDSSFSKQKYAMREAGIGVIVALVTSVFLFLLSFSWFGDFPIAIVLSVALFLSVLVAVIIAVSITFFLVFMKKDPAVGSGPFATILIDIVTIVIYFFTATLLLGTLSAL